MVFDSVYGLPAFKELVVEVAEDFKGFRDSKDGLSRIIYKIRDSSTTQS